MKKAFTMLELVFVIVVMGILAGAIIPSTRTNPVQEAAVQVLSHVRYAQHLAMMDDKYDSTDATWFRERWQIFFANTAGSDNEWAYTIYSDSTNQDGVPNVAEMAINPVSPSKRLTGGYSAGTIAYDDSDATNKLNIGHSYGISSVTFSGSCEVNSMRIAFDHIGRPIYDSHHLLDDLYTNAGTSRLLTQNCDITLGNGTESVVIRIRPETGFACILNAGVCI